MLIEGGWNFPPPSPSSPKSNAVDFFLICQALWHKFMSKQLDRKSRIAYCKTNA